MGYIVCIFIIFEIIGLGETPLNISIEGCDKLPCNMVRGTKVVGGMDFKYGEPIYNATPKQQNHWK
jgi:hypothetical protein